MGVREGVAVDVGTFLGGVLAGVFLTGLLVSGGLKAIDWSAQRRLAELPPPPPPQKPRTFGNEKQEPSLDVDAPVPSAFRAGRSPGKTLLASAVTDDLGRRVRFLEDCAAVVRRFCPDVKTQREYGPDTPGGWPEYELRQWNITLQHLQALLNIEAVTIWRELGGTVSPVCEWIASAYLPDDEAEDLAECNKWTARGWSAEALEHFLKAVLGSGA